MQYFVFSKIFSWVPPPNVKCTSSAILTFPEQEYFCSCSNSFSYTVL